jgi:hypothetical protein
MSVALLELNEAKSALDSGTVIGVSKKAFEGAMERGLENAELMEALEIDVRDGCDGCDGADGGGKLKKVVVFFDSRHGGARIEFESKMADESKMKESDESEGPTAPKKLKAQVVEELLRGVKRPRLARFHLAVEGERKRKAVWVPIDSKLENALRWMVVEEMKDTEVPKAEETDGPTAPKETEGPMAPTEPEVPMAPKKKETEGPEEKKETEPMDTEGCEVPMETETMAPKKKKKERAALLRAKAERAAEAAEKAAEAAREAEREAEEEAAAERESEREQTKLELERARQELERARKEVEGLERKLKQQKDVERRKRAREAGGAERSEESEAEGESRRVAARKEEKEEIVMVDDRQFQEAMGVYGGAVHRVWVERFEDPGPRGTGPVRGGDMVLESVYCSGAEAGEAGEAAEAEELFAKCTGTDGEVVVRGFTDVKEFDAGMEKKKFVKRTVDVDFRCKNTDGPMEPDWYQDTERVWVKRGSAELVVLDKLIANERARKWQWQCPESPRSPVYRPVRPSPVDDDHDDERNVVD